jgi:hypothetical protein
VSRISVHTNDFDERGEGVTSQAAACRHAALI